MGVFAIIHSVVCYVSSPRLSMKQFEAPRAPPPNLLHAHLYGVKNFYTAAMRIYAAYSINNPQLYNLAMFSFAGVVFLNMGELFVWKTTTPKTAFFPLFNSGIGLIWMLAQREWYCR